jgi:hypothetical protein
MEPPVEAVPLYAEQPLTVSTSIAGPVGLRLIESESNQAQVIFVTLDCLQAPQGEKIITFDEPPLIWVNKHTNEIMRDLEECP